MDEPHPLGVTDRRGLLAKSAATLILSSPAGAATMSDRADPVSNGSPRPVIVFDVNETLLDFSVLAPVFVRIFDDATMLRTWFDQVVIYSEALTLAEDYADSGVVGAAVLRMLARIKGRSITDADLDDLKRLSATMPTYADTPPALRRLASSGFRLVTLSNNPSAGVDAQLRSAGIRDAFAQLHSIDDRVHRYKPARASYASLATELGVAPADLWLVSCHAFDTLGAVAAGYRTALVLRPDNAPVALGRPPDIVAGDLEALADRLIRITGPHHPG